MMEIKVNEEFCFQPVYIQVEDELFCVNRRDLETSSLFSDASVPPESQRGKDEKSPIVLEGYNKADFVALLKILSTNIVSRISETGEAVPLALSADDLIGVLDIATSWKMIKVRTYAIRELSSPRCGLTPYQKIELAQRYRVQAWLKDGIVALMSRPLDAVEEYERIGWSISGRVLYGKQKLSSKSMNRNPKIGEVITFGAEAVRCWICKNMRTVSHAGCVKPVLNAPVVNEGVGQIAVASSRVMCSLCQANVAITPCWSCLPDDRIKVNGFEYSPPADELYEELFKPEILSCAYP